jgi:hypothetical protein
MVQVQHIIMHDLQIVHNNMQIATCFADGMDTEMRRDILFSISTNRRWAEVQRLVLPS